MGEGGAADDAQRHGRQQRSQCGVADADQELGSTDQADIRRRDDGDGSDGDHEHREHQELAFAQGMVDPDADRRGERQAADPCQRHDDAGRAGIEGAGLEVDGDERAEALAGAGEDEVQRVEGGLSPHVRIPLVPSLRTTRSEGSDRRSSRRTILGGRRAQYPPFQKPLPLIYRIAAKPLWA